jgi:hypothetical protein
MGVGVGSVVEWNEGERYRCVVAARWIEVEAAKMGTSGYFQKKLRRTREKRGRLGPLARPSKPWADPSWAGTREAWATFSLLFFSIFILFSFSFLVDQIKF